MLKTKTDSQKAREQHRHGGKFIANPCHCCSKGAPMDYYSDARANHTGGWGLVLHARCANALTKLNDAEYAQVAAFAAALEAL